jgi:hypothetical protein
MEIDQLTCAASGAKMKPVAFITDHAYMVQVK